MTQVQIARSLVIALIGALLGFSAAPMSQAAVVAGTLIASAADDSPAFTDVATGIYSLSTSREYETFTVVSDNGTMDSQTVFAYPNGNRIADVSLIHIDGEETVTVVVYFFAPGIETITVLARNQNSDLFSQLKIVYNSSRPDPTPLSTSVDSLTVESISNPGSVTTDDNINFYIRTNSAQEEFVITNVLSQFDGNSGSVTTFVNENEGSSASIDFQSDSITVTANLIKFRAVTITVEAFQTKDSGRGMYAPITIVVVRAQTLELPESVTVVIDNDTWASDQNTEIPSLNTDSTTAVSVSSSGGTIEIDAKDGDLDSAPNVRSLNPETATATFVAGTNTVEITGIDEGTTTIEIGYDGMESATVEVTVNRLSQRPIVLTVDSATIGVSQSTSTQITGGEGDGGITYASSNTGVCTVNSGTGVVTGVATGTCAVTVTKAAGVTGGIKFLAATAAVNVTVDATAPTVSSKATNSGGTKVILTYSETLKSVTPLVGAYAVLLGGEVDTVTAVAIVGSTVELTLATAVINGNSLTVAYTPGSGTEVQDLYGNLAVSFTAAAVTNGVPAPNSGGSSGGGLTFADEEKIRLANEKAAADKLAAEKAAADAAAALKLADEKAAAETAAALKAAAAAEVLKAIEAEKVADAEAAIQAIAEAKAAANTGKIKSTSKTTKITLNLADKYYGEIAFVELVAKVKGRTKITVLDYFVINNQNGTATSIVKKLTKGQRIQVRVGTKIVFRATI